MKNILPAFIFTCTSLFALNSFAQYPCTSGGRYDSEIFSTLSTSSDITYGSAKTVSGTTQTLKLDIYQPSGDTASKRPLIIFGHGGSFIGGAKTDGDVVALCQRFAKMGYVTASYDYRIGMGFPINQANASRAVYRATQDAKAVVRFFRQDAATANTYKIDPSYVYLGGSSAGAFIALHLAYLDQDTEIPSYLDTTGLGNVEGSSGNPGYNSNVNAIINLCGALGNVSWMKIGDEPVCSMHGTIDQTVPYATATISVLGFPIMVVDGSRTVDSMSTVLGLDHVFHTWTGADHVPYASSTAYMDSTVEFVRDFLCTQNLKTAVASVNKNSSKENLIKIYPTISEDEIRIENRSEENNLCIELIDVSGRTLVSKAIQENTFILKKENISRGIYFLKISNGNFIRTEKIIFQ